MRVPAGIVIVVVAGGAAALPSAPAGGEAGAAGARVSVVVECDHPEMRKRFKHRPSGVDSRCSERFAVGRVRWSSYGSRRATGRGVGSVFFDTGDLRRTHPVTIKMFRPVRCRGSRIRVFTRMAYTFAPGQPEGYSRTGTARFGCRRASF